MGAAGATPSRGFGEVEASPPSELFEQAQPSAFTRKNARFVHVHARFVSITHEPARATRQNQFTGARGNPAGHWIEIATGTRGRGRSHTLAASAGRHPFEDVDGLPATAGPDQQVEGRTGHGVVDRHHRAAGRPGREEGCIGDEIGKRRAARELLEDGTVLLHDELRVREVFVAQPTPEPDALEEQEGLAVEFGRAHAPPRRERMPDR